MKTLCDPYGISINDFYKDQVTTAIPVVNPVHAASELEDFMETFDDGINFLKVRLSCSTKFLSN